MQLLDLARPRNHHVIERLASFLVSYGRPQDKNVIVRNMKIRFRRCSVAARKVMDIVSTGVFIMIVIPNHFHGIVKFVGVPLVGTRNSKQPPQMGQSLPTPMGQPSSSPPTGQPQGIAPTGGNAEK